MLDKVANDILELARQPMYAITLIQPWATLIMHYGKDIENRTWSPDKRLPVGSRLWIHAGNSVDLRICKYAKLDPATLPKGQILGHVSFNGTCTSSDSKWFEGPIGWKLSDPVSVQPVTCKGLQKLWKVSDDILEAMYRT